MINSNTVMSKLNKIYSENFYNLDKKPQILKIGAANYGLMRWRGLGLDGKKISLIQKFSHSSGEMVFHDLLEKSCIYRGRKWVPLYISVDRLTDDKFDVLQIDAGESSLTSLSTSEADYLGGCIGSLANIIISNNGEWGRARIQIKFKELSFLKDEILKPSHENLYPLIKENLIKIINLYSQLNMIFERMPLVWAHNDIKFEHIYYQDGEAVFLIDWGMLAPNIIGADLHHFFVDGKSNDGNTLFNQILNSYFLSINHSKVHCSDIRVCIFGAAYFGLRQNLRWANMFPDNNHFIDCINHSIYILLSIMPEIID